MNSWSILKNSRIWRIRTPHVDKMTLLVQAPNEEESKEYFTPPQSSDYNENNRLESNREDQYSQMKLNSTHIHIHMKSTPITYTCSLNIFMILAIKLKAKPRHQL
jgi:hypothetical protein